MALIVNGTTIPTGGDNVVVNGSPVDFVVVNGTQVWNRYVAPGAITDFEASDTAESTITVTFSSASGYPTPTYDLYTEDTLIASDISSGYSFTPTSGYAEYYVKAINTAGTTESNRDYGTAWLGGSSPLEITSSRTVVAGTDFPAATTLTVCMCGGGGGGGSGHNYDDPFIAGGGGGGAGAITFQKTYSSGTTIDATIGAGGTGGKDCDTNGGAGGDTIFEDKTAAGAEGGKFGDLNGYGEGGAGTNGGGNGGDGALYSGSPQHNAEAGEDSNTCGGRFSGGAHCGDTNTSGGGGGAGGFGPGGEGNCSCSDSSDAQPNTGAGGGGGGGNCYGNCAGNTGLGGNGGSGKILISW